jgi:Spy/CpxP family protein refolding chaperone
MMHRQAFLALALTGLVATGTTAAAQVDAAPPPTSAEDSSHRRMKDLIARLLEQRQQLQLTDDQARRLEEIRAKYQEKHKGHLEQMRRDREARRAFRVSMDSARAEVAAVLTPEQEKQVEAMRKEWRKEWRAEHHRRHHDGPHGKYREHDEGEDS